MEQTIPKNLLLGFSKPTKEITENKKILHS